MRTETLSRNGKMIIAIVTAVAVALALTLLITPPAQAGEYGFYYRSGGGGCGGGYFVPPPPVYRPTHRQSYGGGYQQPYSQPNYGYNQPYSAPQQWGQPNYGYGGGYQQPPDQYRETTSRQGNQYWQESQSSWNLPNGGRVRVNQSGPVPAPWQTQQYHW